MGNCCATASGGLEEGKDNVRRKKSQRVANWKATGVIALRRASLAALPTEIAEVPSPRVLDAAENKLEALPSLLQPSLVRLVLSCNRITSIEGIWALHNLKVLALDGNRISQLPPAIGQLARLETLQLSDNLLSELPPSLGRLQRLRQLLVAQNRLARLPEELGDCAALEEVDAHHNALRDLPASLGRLQRLRLLQLDSNQIAAVPPPVLRDCAALATISLHDNPITPAALEATEGYAAFEARRQSKVTKSLATGVLLGHNGLDEGVDRHASKAAS